ncbi:MAG: GTP-binding protein [Pseudonocardiaceae bacterium]
MKTTNIGILAHVDAGKTSLTERPLYTDTPGHPDFISEVERALSVLDGVVIVLSAVEGVQAPTRVFMRTLITMGMPVILFVNKIDRIGARYEDLLDSIRSELTPAVISMSRVEDLGTPQARAVLRLIEDEDFATELVDGITSYFPLNGGEAQGPLRGTVFKIERGWAGEKVAYVRLHSGRLKARTTINFY